MDDNPFLDTEEYKITLAEAGLDPVTRKQLEDGDWNIRAEGRMFKRHWFPIVDEAPVDIKWVRYWDMAATEEKPEIGESGQPCYTVGCKIGMTPDGLFFIKSIVRGRLSPGKVERLVRQTADVDGARVVVWMEQEPGSSGKATISHYRRNILRGFEFRADPVSRSKVARWGPFASQAEAGNVILVRGHWNEDFLDEIELAPDGKYKDQVDAASGGCTKLHGVDGGATVRIARIRRG